MLQLSWGSGYERVNGNSVNLETGAPFYTPIVATPATLRLTYNSPYDNKGSVLVQTSNLIRIDARVPAEHTLNGERAALEMQFVYENNAMMSVFYDVVENVEGEPELFDPLVEAII